MTLASSPPDRAYATSAWLTFALFLSYLSVAMSLPVTTLQVRAAYGYGDALGGLAVGVAFAATILTRAAAGRLSDVGGGKAALARGLVVYALASLVCAGSAALNGAAGYAALIAGRLLLGWGESLATVGMIGWALALMGPARAGRVFALVGMGLYGAFAVGGPLGLALFDRFGYAGVMAAAALCPLLGLAMTLPVAGAAPLAGARASFWTVIGRILAPGFAVALQGVGFAVIGAFAPLLFRAQGWAGGGLSLTAFGAAFVALRVIGGSWPDRFGAGPVALGSFAVEAAGLFTLGLAPNPAVALAGALLSGTGCSLIFPAMGREAVKRTPPHLRGTASGGFAAFQDFAYGVTGPAAGLLADRFGFAVVFVGAGVAAVCGFVLSLSLRRS